MNISFFSQAEDYIKGASSFFLNAFKVGADAYQQVATTYKSIKEPAAAQPEQKKLGLFESIAADKEKAIAILAVAVLAGGLILAARK